MSINHWILLGAAGLFLISFIIFLFEMRPSRWVKNPAPARGKIGRSIFYSFTGAMSPTKKESAYLHLPTYAGGMIFHIGLFSSFAYFVILLFKVGLPGWVNLTFLIILVSGSVSGLLILIKRMSVGQMRRLSNPDDYFSNMLVTGFQIIILLVIMGVNIEQFLLLYCALLLIYIPVGKLRHSFYFFTTRIALGIYYGQRGIWGRKPVKDD